MTTKDKIGKTKPTNKNPTFAKSANMRHLPTHNDPCRGRCDGQKEKPKTKPKAMRGKNAKRAYMGRPAVLAKTVSILHVSGAMEFVQHTTNVPTWNLLSA